MKDFIKTKTDCTRLVDTESKTVEIIKFNIIYEGFVDEWIQEFVEHPENSRLLKNMQKQLKEVLEESRQMKGRL